MKIIISPRAEKQLKKITKVNQVFIAQKIRSLGKQVTSKEEKLKGYKKIYRIRMGDYRIVYKKGLKQLYIILIAHRKDVYKIIKRLFL